MLYIVATPIGNLDDFSPRGIQVLKDIDVLACEDTRRTRILMTKYDIPKPAFVLSYRQGNESRMGQSILRFLQEGKNVALCSDGGYPGISDPGYRLIKLAVEENIDFQVIPGASTVPVALLLSGLSTSSYTFKGYAPRKKGPASRFFGADKELPHTIVIFESPYRVAQTLQAALDSLGDRRCAVCIELTKKFERVSRGWLSELVVEFTGVKIKGEVCIVIAGNNPKFARNESVD